MTEAVTRGVFYAKRCSLIFHKIHRKTPVPKPLLKYRFRPQAQLLYCEFCEIFNNTFFKRTPLVAASVYNIQRKQFMNLTKTHTF